MRSWNPFSPRNWRRKNFDDSHNPIRQIAERETDNDLQKPPQQLLCDVHEEVLKVLPYWNKIENGERLTYKERFTCYSALINSQKRIASLQTKNAINSVRLAFWSIVIAAIAAAFAATSLYIQVNNQKHPEDTESHEKEKGFGVPREDLRKIKEGLKHLAPPE